MNTRAAKSLAAGALVAATAFAVPSAQGAVRSSVFDDVKVWYKGSAGNAVGTVDNVNNRVGLVKNLPNLADTSSAMHGGEYFWWGWRMSYENQPVVCPYAGVSLDSTPCMVVNSFRIEYSAEKLLDAVNNAKTVYFTDRWHWDEIVQRNMKKDVSWEASAKKYLALYNEIAAWEDQ